MRSYVVNGDERNGQMIYERRLIGVKPEQLMYLFENITSTQIDWNPHCNSCDYLEGHPDQGGIDVTCTLIKSPAPFMAGRVFFDARYMFTSPSDGTMYALFSSIGNEEIAADYMDKNKLSEAMAYTTISGHTFRPIKDGQNQTIGTQIYYLT